MSLKISPKIVPNNLKIKIKKTIIKIRKVNKKTKNGFRALNKYFNPKIQKRQVKIITNHPSPKKFPNLKLKMVVNQTKTTQKKEDKIFLCPKK